MGNIASRIERLEAQRAVSQAQGEALRAAIAKPEAQRSADDYHIIMREALGRSTLESRVSASHA